MESKLESTLKKSLEIKEEKIAALEARLEESTNYNQQLRQELKTVSFFFFQNCSVSAWTEKQRENKNSDVFMLVFHSVSYIWEYT